MEGVRTDDGGAGRSVCDVPSHVFLASQELGVSIHLSARGVTEGSEGQIRAYLSELCRRRCGRGGTMNAWLPSVTLLLNIFSVIVLPLVFFVWRRLEQMRVNELRHLEERLERIERKLDEHLQFHLEKDTS